MIFRDKSGVSQPLLRITSIWYVLKMLLVDIAYIAAFQAMLVNINVSVLACDGM